MESPVFPLVQTKNLLPAVRPGAIMRAGLLQKMIDQPFCNLILVCAPAGYGKTTFLTETAHRLIERDWAVAWFSIDPEDDHENVFGAYLFQSTLQEATSPLNLSQIGQVFRISSQVNLKQMMPAFINAVSSNKQKVLLVLDDYHSIKSAPIHDAITFLIDHMPENLLIAIGTRSKPPVHLARWRARGKLLEIDASDLRFNHSETERFLNNLMRLKLSDETIRSLENRTEGWAAGLQLAGLSMAKPGKSDSQLSNISGDHEFLANYLFDEVFDQLTPEKQTFLISTAVLERMTPALCQALLGLQLDCEKMLEELDHDNLFVIPLDEKRRWYRYHHLFRDFLLDRLMKEDQTAGYRLNRIACEWLTANGYLREAANHAFKCGDWDFAAEFVQAHSFDMIIHSEIAVLGEWCTRFPKEVLENNPLLSIYQCWGWVFSLHKENQARIEDRLDFARRHAENIKDVRMQAEVRENELVIRQWMAMAPDAAANPASYLTLAEETAKAYPSMDAGQFSAILSCAYALMGLARIDEARERLITAREIAYKAGLLFGVVESSFQLARLAHARGKLSEAIQICQEAKNDIIRLSDNPENILPAVGCLDIEMGCVFFEQGRLEEAEKRLLSGMNMIGWGMIPHYLMIGCTALYELYEEQDRREDACLYLSNLSNVWPDVSFFTKGLTLLQTLQRDPSKRSVRLEAEKWSRSQFSVIATQSRMPGFGPLGACEVYYQTAMIWMRIQVLLKNQAAAQPIVDSYLRQAAEKGLNERRLELSILSLFMANCAEKEPQESHWDEFSLQLSEARQEGYQQIYSRDTTCSGVLEKALARGIESQYLQEILSGISHRNNLDKRKEGSEVETALIEPLSDREIEIVKLIAKGETNQDIASQLVITVGTVKSHINHILAKLTVKNRTQAVARAREAGLLK